MSDSDLTLPYRENKHDPNHASSKNTDISLNLTIPHSSKSTFKVGTLHINSLRTNTSENLLQLVDDMDKYKIDIL